MRVYIVGFMACGKSTVGRRVAERVGAPFVDLDQAFEAMAGQTVRAAFEEKGEAWFRARETELLKGTAALPDVVVAVGGGTFVFEENREFIRQHGISLFLDVPFEALSTRLARKADRPLFRSLDQARLLYEARLPCYKMADRAVSVSGYESANAVADRVVSALGWKGASSGSGA